MYWEHEITDREFDELMLFISEKKKDGVKVAINRPRTKDYDVVINSLTDFWDIKDEIRSWLKESRADEYRKNIEEIYQEKEWKVGG